MILLFCVIRKDVDDLYKRQTFRCKGLHQSQILHVGNNTTIMHDINRVYVDIIKLVCFVINYGRDFVQLERRVKRMD